jgi:FtsZ-interacting cell division protein YlmF
MKINLKKMFPFGETETNTPSEDEYYNLTNEDASVEGGEGSKLMLLEPRAYSESQQIAYTVPLKKSTILLA